MKKKKFQIRNKNYEFDFIRYLLNIYRERLQTSGLMWKANKEVNINVCACVYTYMCGFFIFFGNGKEEEKIKRKRISANKSKREEKNNERINAKE